jgi:peroxiredoxin
MYKVFFLSIKMKALLLTLTCIVCLATTACRLGTDRLDTQYKLTYGKWRGLLSTNTGGALPFEFEMKMKPDSSLHFILMNGSENIETQDFQIIGDSIIVQFPVYESVIIAKIIGNNCDTLRGVWIKTKFDAETRTNFEAIAGGKYKFAAKNRTMPASIAGKWATIFAPNTPDSEAAIGIFEQSGIDISGTFLTPTGDYRYLTGIADGDSVFLSGFDGASATLIKAQHNGDTLQGTVFGIKSSTKFTAARNPNATLPDANTLTYLKKGYNSLQFSYKNEQGKMINLTDEAYKNKVVIVQVLGTWCHNCTDETAFLSPFYEKYKNKNVEIIGLAFESTNKPEKAADNIARLKKRYNVGYQILHAGTPSPESLTQALPQINKIMSYPTTLIIDKKGKVRRVHTGFSGPSTGIYYTQYCTEFERFITELTNEK